MGVVTDRDYDGQLRIWLQQFDDRQKAFRDLATEAERELVEAIESAGLYIYDHRSRVKKPDSFRKKIEIRQGTEKTYTDPFTEMHDIVGVRITCLFLSDVEIVDRIIYRIFEDVERDDKTKNAPPKEFGYRSVHYDCRLPAGRNGPRYDHVKGITFEIQVRTILQDAWAVVEHTLQYKGENSIPDESSADFTALVGLFHLADKTFQKIRDTAIERDKTAQGEIASITAYSTADAFMSAGADVRIDRSNLKALLQSLYPDRDASTNDEYSELVEELAGMGVTDMNTFRTVLRDRTSEIIEMEEKYPPERTGGGGTGRYTSVGVARMCMRQERPDYYKI